jgi:hypothetical protein
MTKTELITKIQKLLALSSDNGTTEHERNLAYQRAQKLMALYCIENIDLNKEDIKDQIINFEITYPLKGYLKNDNIHKFIFARIAHAFGTFHFFHPKDGKNFIMGFEANCKITDHVIHVLLNRGHIDYKISLAEGNPPTAAHKISFWKGFLEGLNERFIEISDERAIILYDKVKVEYLKKVHPVGLDTSSSDGESGFDSGRDSAKNAQIHNPITSTSGGKLLS